MIDPQDDMKCPPPFAAPAGIDKDAWAEEIGEVAELYGRLLAEKQRVHIEKGRDRGTEYYIADGIRWAIGELERRGRAQGGVTNSEPSSTAPTVEVDEREDAMREAVSDFRKATYEFRGRLDPDDHARMLDAQRRIFEIFRAALASKPPAREAAERLSIGDDDQFQALLVDVMCEAKTFTSATKVAKAVKAIIAHIDTWAARRDGEAVSAGCKHMSTTPHWAHATCNACGAVRTDGSWGIASNKWFKSEAEAKFYQSNGRYPEAAPAAGNTAQPQQFDSMDHAQLEALGRQQGK